ncbi:MAG: TIM barrel protein [Crenarchaeota archaeon]|nr:TIM barrel protein [Thermoproteota archaeon]
MNIIIGVSVPVDREVLRRLRLLRCLGLSWAELGFFRGLNISSSTLSTLREVIHKFGLECSIHCPYFINFCSERLNVRERSLEIVLQCLEICEVLNCELAVVHVGYYGPYGPSRCFEIVRNYFSKIINHVNERGIRAKIAIETMAKDSQFGTLDEVIKLCNEFTNYVVPCIDWAHIYVRYRGNLPFREVLHKIRESLPWLDFLHCHYTSVNDFEDYHVPVGKGPPDFKEVIDALKECNYFKRVIIVCESPLLERDAVKLLKIVRELS